MSKVCLFDELSNNFMHTLQQSQWPIVNIYAKYMKYCVAQTGKLGMFSKTTIELNINTK